MWPATEVCASLVEAVEVPAGGVALQLRWFRGLAVIMAASTHIVLSSACRSPDFLKRSTQPGSSTLSADASLDWQFPALPGDGRAFASPREWAAEKSLREESGDCVLLWESPPAKDSAGSQRSKTFESSRDTLTESDARSSS
ncbi:unnamed protein product [Symbiodinium natans]|uniref:Uncharacterized protein n=1 Tax=Symbiodinium natans TaxID=878477 RepID=A0A812RRB5_9DINO|nr:unnamed protein product [Symbiodinium natans]